MLNILWSKHPVAIWTVAILVCDRFGLCWCRFGMWSFWSVAVLVGPFWSVAILECGHFGLWPFRFMAVLVGAIFECGRFDCNPSNPLIFVCILEDNQCSEVSRYSEGSILLYLKMDF